MQPNQLQAENRHKLILAGTKAAQQRGGIQVTLYVAAGRHSNRHPSQQHRC